MNKNDKRIERNKKKIADFKQLLDELVDTFNINRNNKFLKCWRDEFTKFPVPMFLSSQEALPTRLAARKGTFLSGYPLTNHEYPWPTNSDGQQLVSILQMDLYELFKKYRAYIEDLELKSWLKKLKAKTGPRYLQVWVDKEDLSHDPFIRLIPSIEPDLVREHYSMYFKAPFTEESELVFDFHRAKFKPYAKSAEIHLANSAVIIRSRSNYIKEYLLGDPFFLSGYFQDADMLLECFELDEASDKRVSKYKKRLEKITSARSYGDFHDQLHLLGTYTEDALLADAVDYLADHQGGGWKCLIAKPSTYYFDGEPSITVFYRFREERGEPDFLLTAK